MHERHDSHPKRVGETFDVFAGIPNRAEAMREIVGVAHGDHGVVEEYVIGCATDQKTGGDNVTVNIINIADDDQAERKVAQIFGIHAWDYISASRIETSTNFEETKIH